MRIIFMVILAALSGFQALQAAENPVAEVFFIDSGKQEVICSGKNLENFAVGTRLFVRDKADRVVAEIRITQNNAATVKAKVVSGDLGLIHEKMQVFSSPVRQTENGRTNAKGEPAAPEKGKMVDPVQVKIMDTEENTTVRTQTRTEPVQQEQMSRPYDPRTAEYEQKSMSVVRLVIAETTAIFLPGIGLGHYIVKDTKGGIWVNAATLTSLAMYIGNEYALEYWDAYRYDSAELYNVVRFTAMGIFVAGWLYDMIDTPIKWTRYNDKVKKDLGIAFYPSGKEQYTLALTYRF
jgi:hypothetical protein